MYSGIYALYWWNQDLVYVGQSQNMSSRKVEHFRRMFNGTHSNYKVQAAYTLYGEPDFILLEECSILDLNRLELFWQNELNSLNSLDIVKAGQVGLGHASNASKYSKILLLRVFSCLYKNNLKTFTNIATRCNLVSTSLISDIYKGKSHLWLKHEYPEKYSAMQAVDYKSQSAWGSNFKDYASLIAPDGRLFRIDESVLNTSIDIQQHYYPGESVEVVRKGISRVLSGIRKSWRNWKLATV